MDFEQFKENLTKDVKACFDDRTGADSSATTYKVDKMNYSYEAMVVKPEGSDVGVSIDVNNLYEAYQKLLKLNSMHIEYVMDCWNKNKGYFLFCS